MKPWSELRTKSPVFICLLYHDLNNRLLVCYSGHDLNNGPFDDQTNVPDLNTWLVRNSDPTVFGILMNIFVTFQSLTKIKHFDFFSQTWWGWSLPLQGRRLRSRQKRADGSQCQGHSKAMKTVKNSNEKFYNAKEMNGLNLTILTHQWCKNRN